MEYMVSFAWILPDYGADLMDVSFIGGTPGQTNLNAQQSSLSDASLFSANIEEAVGCKLVVGSVGGYTNGEIVETVEDVRSIMIDDLEASTVDGGLNKIVFAHGGAVQSGAEFYTLL
ncbi:hypothetical protein JAAARDRAFT_198532 [Jaapia argillacea MUCL 33604]|uniref:Uncharacterized protein n=1 Tax=Jaapia argillacea MUCL 33604 TaxID=933084 RepID=A0A067PB09_9AGAM|nr:hypothetical protein JAAARDRAFT_198532 [Jaapia argillacea MUCL 33604]